MFLSLDGTFWIQLLNFAIFYAILNVVFLRPVGAAIRKRRDYIDSVASDYERYAHEAKELRASADSTRAQARRAGAESFAGARSQASIEASAISEDYAQRAATIMQKARDTVEGEIATARAKEPALVQTLAQALLDRAIGAVAR
ncbi:MAG TPA: ATP synthase F0 subunit B [Candidatus Baltobacteraceae bacterium]